MNKKIYVNNLFQVNKLKGISCVPQSYTTMANSVNRRLNSLNVN